MNNAQQNIKKYINLFESGKQKFSEVKFDQAASAEINKFEAMLKDLFNNQKVSVKAACIQTTRGLVSLKNKLKNYPEVLDYTLSQYSLIKQN